MTTIRSEVVALARVVVVGAGYAGVMAANRLAAVGRSKVRVTVVNPRPEFVERVRLHEHAAGESHAVRPLSGLLHRDVRLRTATVDVIEKRSVRLDDGDAVAFDYLLYAVGSTSARGLAGSENVWSVADLDGADALRTRLRQLPPGARVVVIGGGLTGIESAAEIAYRYPSLEVSLVSRTVAARLPESSRASIEGRLANAGVVLRTGLRVTGVRPDGIETDAGPLPSDCTVWAGSFDVPDLALRSGLPVTSDGRLRTDDALVCVHHRRIVGAGDAVAPPGHVGAHLRMSCQAAMPMGAHGADTVLALIRGERPAPISIGMAGQAISLGRRDGFIQATHRDDTPRASALSGRVAALLKERVCRYTVTAMRFPRAYRWLPGPPSTPTPTSAPKATQPQPHPQR
ncbi:NAD(P)/FAD-dependent oxidoreductase [Streptomyces sp. CB02959]|uniref:NAD(P)/FAD-dependent oxidoreductase n=1 Tax=Streptomyces sp. CB02959 TaxID=2020330 RepID=UPI0021536928|nr:FAD-dependent oxidoreductase [Streptomyces sp. CB02959]